MSEVPTKKQKLDSNESATETSSDQHKALINEKFLVSVPEDFYDFWSFLKTINSEHPEDVLKKFGLSLAGPYDVLLNKKSEKDSDYLLHHRFYYDSPEFLTVLIGDKKTGYHIGYFRDSPHDEPVFLASNEESTGCKLTILGDNIFAAVYNYLNTSGHKSKSQTMIQKLEKFMTEKNYSSLKRSPKIKQREKKVVSKGFHGIGLVVPVDDNDIGWREVPRTIGELKSLFSSIVTNDKNSQKSADELHELITYVQFANDECDYGQGLELGHDLFCYGDEALHGYIKTLMPMAYSLLNYEPFERIILQHLDQRLKGQDNSYLK